MDYNDLLNQLAQHGVKTSSKSFRNVVRDAQNEARSEFAKKYNVANPIVSERIKRVFGWLSIAFTVAFLFLGVIVAVTAFAFTEYHATHDGLVPVTGNSGMAALTAWTLIIGTVVGTFMASMMSVKMSNPPRVNLGLITRRLGYFMGVSRNTEGFKKLTPQEWQLIDTKIATMTGYIAIVVFGMFGRADELIKRIDAPITSPFANIDNILVSELIWLAALGALILTIILLMDKLVYFLYTVFNTTTGGLDFFVSPKEGELEGLEDEFVRDRLELLLAEVIAKRQTE